MILVNNREGWTRYCRVAVQTRDQTSRERSLSAPEIAFESQHRTGNKLFPDSSGDRFRFSGTVGSECSHGATCDFVAISG